MINSDRHEVETRTKLLEIILAYQIQGELFGIPQELREQFVTYQPEALHAVTDEIYQLLIQEIQKNGKRKG